MTFLLVRTHMIRPSRSVFRFVFRRACLLVFPSVGATLVILHSSIEQLSQLIPRKFQREAIDCRVLRLVNWPDFRHPEFPNSVGPNQIRRLQICPAQCIHLTLDEIVSNQRQRRHSIEILLSLVLKLPTVLKPSSARTSYGWSLRRSTRRASSAEIEISCTRIRSPILRLSSSPLSVICNPLIMNHFLSRMHHCVSCCHHDGQHDDDGIVLTTDSRGKICGSDCRALWQILLTPSAVQKARAGQVGRPSP